MANAPAGLQASLRRRHAMVRAMAKLGIHLQNGFENDEVIVRAGGQELMRRENVSTRRILGVAAHDEFDVSGEPLSLHVSIPSRDVEQDIELEAGEERYVGISLDGGALRVSKRAKPFGYG
jgi:hypothetical protein